MRTKRFIYFLLAELLLFPLRAEAQVEALPAVTQAIGVVGKAQAESAASLIAPIPPKDPGWVKLYGMIDALTKIQSTSSVRGILNWAEIASSSADMLTQAEGLYDMFESVYNVGTKFKESKELFEMMESLIGKARYSKNLYDDYVNWYVSRVENGYSSFSEMSYDLRKAINGFTEINQMILFLLDMIKTKGLSLGEMYNSIMEYHEYLDARNAELLAEMSRKNASDVAAVTAEGARRANGNVFPEASGSGNPFTRRTSSGATAWNSSGTPGEDEVYSLLIDEDELKRKYDAAMNGSVSIATVDDAEKSLGLARRPIYDLIVIIIGILGILFTVYDFWVINKGEQRHFDTLLKDIVGLFIIIALLEMIKVIFNF